MQGLQETAFHEILFQKQVSLPPLSLRQTLLPQMPKQHVWPAGAGPLNLGTTAILVGGLTRSKPPIRDDISVSLAGVLSRVRLSAALWLLPGSSVHVDSRTSSEIEGSGQVEEHTGSN